MGAAMTPVYRRVLGQRFDELPPQVRALHDVTVPATWTGRADVVRGTSFVIRLIALLTGIPATADGVALTVTFTPDATGERWERRFGRRVFASHQRAGDGVIRERMGPATIVLRPRLEGDSLCLGLDGMTVLGLPVPRVLWPVIATREQEVGGRYRFEVEARLPLVGLLVRYAGHLEPQDPRTVPKISALKNMPE